MVTIAEVDFINEIKLCQRKMNYIECLLDDINKKDRHANSLFRKVEDYLNDLISYLSENIETPKAQEYSKALRSSYAEINDILQSKLRLDQDNNQNDN